MNTTIAASPNDPYSLLRIGEAWRNRAGLTTLLATFVCVAVLWVLGVASHSAALMALLALVSFAVYLLGFAAAGTQFMAQAAGNPVGGTLAALLASPLISLRMLGAFLLLLAFELAVAVVAAILLLLCKIPFLGPIVYVVVLPGLTFAAALIFLGLAVISSLAAPALWEGLPLKTAFSRVWAVVSQRSSQALLNLMLLVVVQGAISALLTSVIFAGFGMTAGLSAGILGNQMAGGFGSLFGSMMGNMGGMGGYGGGYGGEPSGGGLVIAGMLGGAIVFAVTVALIAAMAMMGLSLVYLKLNVGIDAGAAEAAMDAAIAKTKEKAQQAADEARRRAQEAQAAAQQKLEQARAAQAQRSAAATAAPPPAAPPADASPPAAAINCPACGTPASADDVFCGHCGHKLK